MQLIPSLLLGLGGGIGAAVLDAKYPEKSITLPLVNQTIEPGAAAAGAALILAILGVPGATALAVGGLAFEGGKMYSARSLPSLPPPTAAVSGYDPYAAYPRGYPQMGVGAYSSVSDREIAAAMASLT